jgi:hypothetical protein
VSSRLNAHLFIVPTRLDDVSYRPDVLRTKASPSGQCGFPSGHSSVSRSFCFNLHLSERLTSLSGRPSVIELQIFFPKENMGRLLQPSDRATLLRKVRNSNSTVWTPVYLGSDASTIDMEIAYSRSTVRTAIPHGPDPRSVSNEITCSGRATVRTTVPHRPDAALK